MKQKIALITGITDQDGAYLAKFLIKKNYIDKIKKKMKFSPKISLEEGIRNLLNE